MSERTPNWMCHRCATGNLIHLHQRCRLCGHERLTCDFCTGPSENSSGVFGALEDEGREEEIDEMLTTQGTSNSTPDRNPNATPNLSQSTDSRTPSQSPGQQDAPRSQPVNLENINAAAWVANNRHAAASTDPSNAERLDQRRRQGSRRPDLGTQSRAWWR